MAGLRERKKRQTRRYISDVATGLFLERGFDAVTVAEIAEAADVSVNTVYNYFPAKEDLFFDREEEIVDYASRCVRERGPGVSAAEALLACLRGDIKERNWRSGLTPDFARFIRVVRESTALSARMQRMQYEIANRLTETLREEVGAEPGDHTPELVALHLCTLSGIAHRAAAIGQWQGGPVDEIAQLVLDKLDAAEALLSRQVLDSARRPPAPGA